MSSWDYVPIVSNIKGAAEGNWGQAGAGPAYATYKYLEDKAKQGSDTAAMGAKEAEARYRELAEKQWQRYMEGLRLAMEQMGGSRDMAARFAGAGRPDGPAPARMVDAQRAGMSDADYINAMMSGGPSIGHQPGRLPVGVPPDQIRDMKDSRGYLASMMRMSGQDQGSPLGSGMFRGRV